VEEAGNRLNTMKMAVRTVSEIYKEARFEGIRSIRFLNKSEEYSNILPERVDRIISEAAFHGLTRIGAELHRKIIQPYVAKTPMLRPLLVMVIIDGDV
jgi:hypothetical protein